MVEDMQFYDIKETAEKLEVSVRTVRRYIKDGRLDAYKIGNKIRVTPENLRQFIEDNKI